VDGSGNHLGSVGCLLQASHYVQAAGGCWNVCSALRNYLEHERKKGIKENEGDGMNLPSFILGGAAAAAFIVTAALLDVYVLNSPEVRSNNKVVMYLGWCGFEALVLIVGLVIGKWFV